MADYKTPKVTKGYTADTQPYPLKPAKTTVGSAPITYHPLVTIDEHAYGKSAGTPNLVGGVPSMVTGGSSETGTVPTLTGTFSIGEDKNVSTPVTG